MIGIDFFVLFFATRFLQSLSLTADIDYDSKLFIRLEHSFDASSPPVFTHRGDIAIKSLHTGSSTLEQAELNDGQVKALRRLADESGNYRLKATVTTPDGQQSTFLSFVKACALVESRLADIVSVNVDHVGSVVGVTLSTAAGCGGEGGPEGGPVDEEFSTSVLVRHMEVGPAPDTASYIQKLEREKEAKERGDTKDNRSFLAKYWMYIVPVVIFLLLSNAPNPEAGGQR